MKYCSFSNHWFNSTAAHSCRVVHTVPYNECIPACFRSHYWNPAVYLFICHRAKTNSFVKYT